MYLNRGFEANFLSANRNMDSKSLVSNQNYNELEFEVLKFLHAHTQIDCFINYFGFTTRIGLRDGSRFRLLILWFIS